MSPLIDSLQERPGRVLVVDDEEKNRRILRDLLELDALVVQEACDGEEALERVTSFAPDVVLLDVMMPRLDGFEVCRRLKADPKTAPLPVILVTALSGRENRIEGISAGANDFLTKPIDPRDVRLRVRNSVTTKLLYDRVEADNQRLRELEQLRDGLTGMIVHDLRSPLGAIRMYLQLLEYEQEQDEPDLDLQAVLSSSSFMLEMINQLLDVGRLEANEMPLSPGPAELPILAQEAIDLLREPDDGDRVTLSVEGNLPGLQCDADVIRRVICNLVGNAKRYSPDVSPVSVEVRPQDDGVRISVVDSGPGVPPELHDRIFEKFGQVEALRSEVKHSSGLGLTFCKLAVEAHGGVIGLQSEVDQGSTFWFQLPGVR